MPDLTAHNLLFADPGLSAYAILDGASVPDLPQLLHHHAPEHVCLYRGELAPDLAATAPYLIRLEPEHSFTTLVLTEGWGQHWGVFCTGATDLRTLRNHFRGFLMVYGPAYQPLYFRYYDPRVLRTYLPTCLPQELATIFGPLDAYLMESADATAAVRMRFSDDALMHETLPVIPLDR